MKRPRSVRLALLTCVVLLARPGAPSANSPTRPPVKALIAAVQTYVADFEAKVAYGLFDEDYTQAVRGDEDQNRRMHGELFLTFLPTDGDWIAVHDVAEVDDQPVMDRQSLQSLLQLGPLESIGRAVMARNARFNIGTIQRNFNEPTLALLILEPRHIGDFNFSVSRVDTDATGAELATIEFSEKGGVPTLIRGTQGDEIRSKGQLVVEVPTGRIHQTVFSLNPSGMSVSLTTFYSYNAAVDLWLPTLFQERYERKKDGPREVVTCEARYTNFRRFEVLGRIKD